jgi:hypothetical protein
MSHPTPYKPRIDAALGAFAHHAGSSADSLSRVLQSIDTSDRTAWGYLVEALDRARPLLVSDHARRALQGDWFLSFLIGEPGANALPRWDAPDLDELGDGEDPFDLESYPVEAHEALLEGHFVGGDDADIVLLWGADGGPRVCHAHPEGFWILGEDPADFAERAAQKLERTN